jgi:Immunity protein 49
MIHIARHEHGWEIPVLQEELNYYKEDLQDALVKVTKKPSNLGSLLRTAITYAGYLSVLDPNSTELKRTLRIAAYTAKAIFQLSDRSITIEYDLAVGEGPLFSFPQTGPTSDSNCRTWETGYYLALACREKHILDSLVTKPTEIARQSSLISNEYSYLMVDALKSFYNFGFLDSCEPDTPINDTVQKLTAALRATDPNEIMESTIDAMLNLVVPAMEMIFRLLEGDSQAFNAALEKALNLHKKHWSSSEQISGDPRGFIAIAPLGIACYAYDAGFPIEVESEYIPKYIIEKQYLLQKKAA